MEASIDIDTTSSNGSVDSVESIESKEKPLIVDVPRARDNPNSV